METKIPAVKMRNITKTFGKVVANDKVWLDIYRGEILALLGDNELCYIKAETASAAVTASGSITSVKWLEKMRDVAVIDMCVGIAHLSYDHA